MNDFDDDLKSTNESLAQIEKTMTSMISMAENGHFPFLNSNCEIFQKIESLPLLSPHRSKKILYQSLVKCRRHKCFQRKMTIIENLSFDDKAQLVKALVTLAADKQISSDFTIH